MKTFIAKVKVVHTYEAIEELEYIINAKSVEDAKKAAKIKAYDGCDSDKYCDYPDHQDSSVSDIDISYYVKKFTPAMRCKRTIDMFLG